MVLVHNRYFELSDLQLDKYQSGLIEHVLRDDGLTPWSRLPPVDSLNLVNVNTRYLGFNPLHNQARSKTITSLMENLPRIRSLTVVQQICDLSVLDQIAQMIDHWRNDLVSLKLYLHHELFSQTDSLHNTQLRARTLFDSINRATSLKHLKLKFDHFQLNTRFTRLPLSILSQLSTFDLNAFTDHLGDELVRYASANHDLQISTNCSLDFLLEINQEFCNRFVDVKLVDFNIVNRMGHGMYQFCTRFSSLVHLSINNQNEMPVTRLAQCLSSLTQLVHLRMRLTASHLESNLAQHQELSLDQIVPIPSVRLLTLQLFIQSHSATEQFHLPEVFPNVQVLSIESIIEGCADCGLGLPRMRRLEISESAPRHRECAQLARRPFRHLPRLHTIQIDVNDSVFLSDTFEKKLITKDEL